MWSQSSKDCSHESEFFYPISSNHDLTATPAHEDRHLANTRKCKGGTTKDLPKHKIGGLSITSSRQEHKLAHPSKEEQYNANIIPHNKRRNPSEKPSLSVQHCFISLALTKKKLLALQSLTKIKLYREKQIEIRRWSLSFQIQEEDTVYSLWGEAKIEDQEMFGDRLSCCECSSCAIQYPVPMQPEDNHRLIWSKYRSADQNPFEDKDTSLE